MKKEARSRKPGARMSALVVVTGLVCFGAINPVEWTLSSDVLKAALGATVPLRLTAKIDEGWHIYSVTTPPPTLPLQIKIDDAAAHVFQPKPTRDQLLGVEAEFYEKEA